MASLKFEAIICNLANVVSGTKGIQRHYLQFEEKETFSSCQQLLAAPSVVTSNLVSDIVSPAVKG
jgi:hypothetical protein